MPALSPTELGYLRDQHPSAARVEWYLAVAPYGDACFTAQVNDGAIARGVMTITYDNDVGEANVQAGMTLWIGTSAGDYDVGKVRIRSINAGANTLDVAENDHIEWADDLYLTCPGAMGFRELWGVYQRMTEAAGVVTFYQDYDVTYNDPPDDVLPPKANAGPPVCAWLDTSGNADVSFVGEQSYTTEVGAAIAAYAWDFADGAVIVGGANQAGTCAVPNVVRFTTPGFRYISLTVTDNTGQARTAIVYVPVWIFQEGVEEPFGKVEVLSQSGDLSGWSTRLRVFQTDTAAEDIIYDFPPGALAVLFTRTWYGDTEIGVGGFCYRENVRFVGWLDRETLKFDYEAGFVEFEAIGNAKLLSRIPGFAFTLEDDATPSDWYEMNDLNVDRALHHLLHYHTTVNQVCHVERVGEGATRDISIQVFPDASLYTQAQDNLLRDAQCLLTADRQGTLRATQDPQFLDLADRAGIPIVCTLVSTDWMNDLDATSPHVPGVGLVRLGGFHYETPLLSQAPGDAPRQQEAELRVEGCILQDQAEANLWSGLALTKANNEFPQVPITLSGYWPVFDPAFQEYLRLTTTDPLDRNVWVNERFIIRGVTFRDLSAQGTTTTALTLEAESIIQTGETVTIPDPPPPEPPDPPPPPLPPPVEPPIILEFPDIVFVRRGTTWVYRTGNWTDPAPAPTWTDITGTLTNIRRILVDQTNRYCYAQCNNGIWRISVDDTTPVWLRVFNPATDLPPNTAAWYPRGMAITIDGYIGFPARALDACATCTPNNGLPVMLVLRPDGTLDELLSQFGCPIAPCCPFDAWVSYWHQGVWSTVANPWHMCSDLTALYLVGDCRGPMVGGRNHICAATRGDANYVMTDEGDFPAAWGALSRLVAFSGDIIGTYNIGPPPDIYRITPGVAVWTDLTPVAFHKPSCYGFDRDIVVDYVVVTDQDRLYDSVGGVFAQLLLRGDIGTGTLHHCSCYYDDTDQLFLASNDDILWTINGGAAWSTREGNLAVLDYREIRPVWTEASTP